MCPVCAQPHETQAWSVVTTRCTQCQHNRVEFRVFQVVRVLCVPSFSKLETFNPPHMYVVHATLRPSRQLSDHRKRSGWRASEWVDYHSRLCQDTVGTKQCQFVQWITMNWSATTRKICLNERQQASNPERPLLLRFLRFLRHLVMMVSSLKVWKMDRPRRQKPLGFGQTSPDATSVLHQKDGLPCCTNHPRFNNVTLTLWFHSLPSVPS